jgi:hypothetical protein
MKTDARCRRHITPLLSRKRPQVVALDNLFSV